MATLTLISDIGSDNHDLSRFRIRLKQQLKGLELEIISASVSSHDINEAAYILNSVINDFPEGTIHIVDVLSDLKAYSPAMYSFINGQWIISANNGLVSLLNGRVERSGVTEVSANNPGLTFSLINTFMPMAKELLETKGKLKLKDVPELVEKSAILPVSTENSLRGTVIHVDHFGNAVTNITREILERNRNGRKMLIRLNRHDWIASVSEYYGDAVDDGNIVCVWTENGHLQVSVFHGNATRLLGLSKGKMITIDFE